jgi:hypothetical protein
MKSIITDDMLQFKNSNFVISLFHFKKHYLALLIQNIFFKAFVQQISSVILSNKSIKGDSKSMLPNANPTKSISVELTSP